MRLAKVEQRGHVGVADLLSQPSLAFEALSLHTGGVDDHVHHLQSHRLLAVGVDRAIHRGASTAANCGLNPVALGNDVARGTVEIKSHAGLL